MRRILVVLPFSLAFAASLSFVASYFVVTSSAYADPAPEKRIAFVVGNETYAAGALPTAANDAGLVAQTLQAAGFEVVGARDLDAETLRQSYADFLKRLGDAGPDTVAFIYLSGYGLQYGNENYYVPIGANVSRDLDIPVSAVRLSDLTGPLNAMNLKARFMVFDAAYKPPFKTDGAPLAGGLALVDASPGSLIAYNAAPGTIALPAKGNYGVYAQSLAAMLREGGLAPDEIFDRLRLRVDEQTKGAAVPWDSSKIDAAFRFFDRGKDAPAPAGTAAQFTALNTEPLKNLPVKEAYTAALARDTVASYSEFDASYGGDPLGKRVRVLLAVRREEVTWRRTVSIDTPDAYWSYLSRYPRGPHAGAARLRLQDLSAALVPPSSYPAIAYDVPPPPPDEAVYIDQPVVYLDDPAYDFPPPPPPPDYWLPPVPVDFIDLGPPPPPIGLFFLPVPAFIPLPDYYSPPPFVAYPENNYFYGGGGGVPYDRRIGIGNGGVNIHRGFPAGGLVAAGVGAAAVAAAVVLPRAVQQRSTTLQRQGITTPAQLRTVQTRPGGPGSPGGAGAREAIPANHQLPGANGRTLPSVNGRAVPNTAAAGGVVRPNAGPGPGIQSKTAKPSATFDRKPNAIKSGKIAPSQTVQPRTPRLQTQRGGRAIPQTEVRQPARVQSPRPQIREPQQQFRAPPQQFRAPPQQFRQAPQQQFRQAPQQQQFRQAPQQFRGPPQAGPRPGGFGGGGPRPGGGGGGAPPRPAQGGGGKPPLHF